MIEVKNKQQARATIDAINNANNNANNPTKTLRDEFAMAALPSAAATIKILDDEQLKEIGETDRAKAIASLSYGLADKMLEIRNKGE